MKNTDNQFMNTRGQSKAIANTRRIWKGHNDSKRLMLLELLGWDEETLIDDVYNNADGWSQEDWDNLAIETQRIIDTQVI